MSEVEKTPQELLEGTRTGSKLEKVKAKIHEHVAQIFNVALDEFAESPGAKHIVGEYLNTTVEKILADALESAKYVPGSVGVNVPAANLSGKAE